MIFFQSNLNTTKAGLFKLQRERAVNAVVTYAMKIAIAMRLNKIQTTEKIRAMADLGALSPYLANKKGTK